MNVKNGTSYKESKDNFMNFLEILNESKKRENYQIITKKNFYFIINKEENIIGKKLGYKKLDDAIDFVLKLTSKKYKNANFYKKKEMMDKEIIKWKNRNGIKETKPRKKYGFFEIDS
jgi:HD superfamily phosphohydrolase